MVSDNHSHSLSIYPKFFNSLFWHECFDIDVMFMFDELFEEDLVCDWMWDEIVEEAVFYVLNETNHFEYIGKRENTSLALNWSHFDLKWFKIALNYCIEQLDATRRHFSTLSLGKIVPVCENYSVKELNFSTYVEEMINFNQFHKSYIFFLKRRIYIENLWYFC